MAHANPAKATMSALTNWWSREKPSSPSALRSEAVAGIPGAIGSVPDGMAASVLAGVNPIHGLYASFVGPIGGGLTSSTRLMVVTTTSAAALAAGSALADVPADERAGALFLMTLLAGAFMVIAGVFKLGRYTRFVSQSVMTGFLTGVAVNIVLSQIPDLTGGPSEGDIALAKAVSALLNPSEMYLPTLVVGLGALAIVTWLSGTRLGGYAALMALIIPTLFIELVGTPGVKRVDDVGEIPSGIPLPHLPGLGDLSLSVVFGALAVAAIVLVQGAGVSESSPNEDGSRSNANQDFVAQGVGNIAAGLWRGQPVGGSVGQTALNVSAGARTRWASIFSGIWMFVILVAFSGAVGVVAMACLAAVLIFAALSSISVPSITTVWNTGLNSQIAMTITFLATMFFPIYIAVALGVALSLLLQLNQEMNDLRLVERKPLGDGLFEEQPAPRSTPDGSVLLLDAYGSLRYAGSRTLEEFLPDPTDSVSPVVVLRLRGRLSFGATFIVVITDYADRLAAVGGHLILTGVQTPLMDRVRQMKGNDLYDEIEVFEATDIVGEATMEAYDAAEEWLAIHDEPPDEVDPDR